MTEAGWTRNKPTKEGWYWWRDTDRPGNPFTVRVVSDGYGLIVYGMEEYSRRLYDTNGEWLGPITPDSYQQGRVAGLEEAARRADKIGNQSSSSHVRSVVGLIVMDLYEQLAQAAQEGGVGDAEN